MVLVLGNFNANIRRESYSCSLHEESNDNGAKLVNFAARKGLVEKARCSREKIYTSIDGY